MKKIKLVLVLTFLTVINIYAEENLIEEFKGLGIVNWSKCYIQTTGQSMTKESSWTPDAKIKAHRAAQLDGMRKLLQISSMINIDSDVKVENLVQADKKIKVKIEGTVKNFTEAEPQYQKEGICELLMTIPLTGKGALSDVILGKEELNIPVKSETQEKEEQDDIQTLVQSTEVEEGSLNQIEVEIKEDPQTKKQAITGLVIDASGQKVRPALNPKIINESGEVVYGFQKANRDFRRINGLASYVPHLNSAKLDKRVTRTPYLVPALKVKEGKPCIIVISDKDAEIFNNKPESMRILDHCRVIIVTGKPDSN